LRFLSSFNEHFLVGSSQNLRVKSIVQIPSVQSLIGESTVGTARTPRTRDIRSGRPCLSQNDDGTLTPIASCPRRGLSAQIAGLVRAFRTRRPRFRVGFSQELFRDAAKLVLGVISGFALIGALVLLTVGLSNFPRVKWDVIGAALRGQSVLPKTANAQIKPASRRAPSGPADATHAPIAAASAPVATRAQHPADGIPLPGLSAALYALPDRIPALPAVVPAGQRSPEAPPTTRQETPQRETGVHVDLLASDRKQPNLHKTADVGVHVNLLPQKTLTTPHQAASVAAVATPSPSAWHVVTVTAGGLVVSVDGVMRTVAVGDALPDGRIVRTVNEASGAWAAAKPSTPSVLPNPSQEKTDHGISSTANVQRHPRSNANADSAERQPVPGASDAH
jgi:hypothetical protein